MSWFGKYSGKVAKNMDPLGMGRIQVTVPAVLGEGSLSWALPCVPYAGPKLGFLAVPPVGANVWVEFEGGDADRPIWAGCFWGAGELPRHGPHQKFLHTDAVKLDLDDTLGVTLEVGPPVVSDPLKIVLNAGGIELSNGSAVIKLSATSMTVNDGALEVT